MKLLTLITFSLFIFAGAAISQTFNGTITIPGVVTNGTAIVTLSKPMRVSDYPERDIPLQTDLLLLADTVNKTNVHILFPKLAYAVQSQTTNYSVAWSGPTNTVNLLPYFNGSNDYFFSANTPCSVTGYTYSPGVVNWALLTISNASPSNITFTLPADSGLPIGDSQPYTVTNGHVLKASLQIADGSTNTVTRVFVH